METKIQKQLPYGISNFEKIRTKNYVYIDKTRYIELLEQEANDNLFFTRPRKFGKSLFFSMLSNYYDNSYLVLKLNFSGLGIKV
jgi:hypothetical protein